MFPSLVRGEPSPFRLGAELWGDFGLSGDWVCRVTGPTDNMEGQEREGLETEET